MDKIVKIPGEAPELYTRVAPLVMSISCLRENNNYPYKTSEKHVWYIILCGDRTTAFMPVEEIGVGGGKYKIDNYYASATEGRERQLGRLVKKILSDYKGKGILSAVVQTRDLKIFTSYGFTVFKEWKRYVKMCFDGAVKGEAYGDN